MSELIQQVNKLREDASAGSSTAQSTQTTDTQPKKKPESSAEVIMQWLSLPWLDTYVQIIYGNIVAWQNCKECGYLNQCQDRVCTAGLILY